MEERSDAVSGQVIFYTENKRAVGFQADFVRPKTIAMFIIHVSTTVFT